MVEVIPMIMIPDVVVVDTITTTEGPIADLCFFFLFNTSIISVVQNEIIPITILVAMVAMMEVRRTNPLAHMLYVGFWQSKIDTS